MKISQLHEHYWFHEGAIRSIYLDLQKNRAEIALSIRRHVNRWKGGRIREEDLLPCTLQLTFADLVEVSLFDKFPTEGFYLNVSTFEDDKGTVGMAFTVHDNAGYVHEKDNWVIKAKKVSWREI